MGSAAKNEVDIEDLGRSITHPTRVGRRHHRLVSLPAMMSLVRSNVAAIRGAVPGIGRVSLVMMALLGIGALIMLVARTRTREGTTTRMSRPETKPARRAFSDRPPLSRNSQALPIVVDKDVRRVSLAMPSELPEASRRRTAPLVNSKHERAGKPRPADMPDKGRAQRRPISDVLPSASPHLTGDALRRALAQDVLVTRRTNQRELANPTER